MVVAMLVLDLFV